MAKRYSKRISKRISKKSILPKPKKPGFLRSFGYSTKKSAEERHLALKKAISSLKRKKSTDPYLELSRRLVLISNFNKNITARKILQRDARFLRKQRK